MDKPNNSAKLLLSLTCVSNVKLTSIFRSFATSSLFLPIPGQQLLSAAADVAVTASPAAAACAVAIHYLD